MIAFENLESGKRNIYSNDYFSGDYNQTIYLKKSIDDGSNKPKFYLSAFTNINGNQRLQGYLYFYLDYETKQSYFIGLKINPEYRNINMASLLISLWIDLCLNNGYDFLSTNKKQRKPFLLYLLKTYGFEILNRGLYLTSEDVIHICKSKDETDINKYLLFKNKQHEKAFTKTNSYNDDNYIIIPNENDIIIIDDIIMPIQNRSKNNVNYIFQDEEKGEKKVIKTLSKHKR